MKILMLKKDDIHKGNLILVNRTNPIKYDKVESDIILTPVDIVHTDIFLELGACVMLSRLMEDLSCGSRIVPVSGYRTFEQQSIIYHDSLTANGYDFTSKYVAVPNQSEHQTGLAIDLAYDQQNIDFICPEFPDTGIGRIFRQHAAKYGFIERYPKGKEEITGIAYEPWHFRYIGCPHAEFISKYALTLEEYIQSVKGYTYRSSHLKIDLNRYTAEIFYVDGSQASIELPDNALYQISGNNSDGFIFTLWRESK